MEIEGLDKLNEKLNKLKKIPTAKALLKGAYLLQRYSMENAPVRTGFLRQSHESVEVEKGAELRVNAEYSFYVEMKKPYVRPAIDEHSDEIVKVVSDGIENEVKGAI